ncbi:MAG: MFS transporter, partial [Alphaproteobacteria bacterium]|nr:MFS transporter [Alphaproteobacteria bacterium]
MTAGRTVFALIVGMVAIGPLSTDLYLPSLPAIGKALDADVAHVQLTLSAYMCAFALVQLVYGPLSDRYGRRP